MLPDALMTTGQARGLADWIAASGKNLKTVYITHGHGDHWFGLGTVLERFPDARAVAVQDVVEYMRRSSASARVPSWTASCRTTRPVPAAASRPDWPLELCTGRCDQGPPG